MVIIMAILGISPQGEVTQESRAELRAARAIPRLADEPVALVIIIRVSRRHLERFGEVEFLNEFVLTSQKAAFVTEFEARAFVVVNFALDSEVPLVRRPCRLMYVSVHSGRLGNRTSDALCRTGTRTKGNGATAWHTYFTYSDVHSTCPSG